MRPARRRRTLPAAAVLSVVVHLGLIAALATYAPRLVVPRESAGPPQAVIPVLIMPRAPPPVAGGPTARPTTIRLHRRAQRFAPAEAPVAPLVVPEAPAQKAAPSPAPKVVAPPTPEEAVGPKARQALRGMVGCAYPDAVGLTAEERQKCKDRFAAGAKDADFPGLGLEPRKAGDLARAGARKEADYNYKRSAPTPSSAPSSGGPGSSADELGRRLGNDRSSLKIPF